MADNAALKVKKGFENSSLKGLSDDYHARLQLRLMRRVSGRPPGPTLDGSGRCGLSEPNHHDRVT